MSPPPANPARRRFLVRVYGHLLAALALFVAAEVALFRSGVAARLAAAMYKVPWPLILGAYIVVGWLASRAAHRLRSPGAQYAALGVYVAAKAVIFVPLLDHAERFAPGTLELAAQLTLLAFAGLTWIGATVRLDLGFLRPFLLWGGFVALLLILSAWLYGWRLGTWFSVAMVALAGASVLYDTQKVHRRFRGDRHVAAALRLFASIAMMFWYGLRLLRRAQRASA